MSPDDLDGFISDRTRRSVRFPELMAEARIRRRIASELAAFRKKKRLSQAQVAAGMATTQSIVSKLENGADVKLSTLLKYADAVGARVVVARKVTTSTKRKKPRSRAKAAAG